MRVRSFFRRMEGAWGGLVAALVAVAVVATLWADRDPSIAVQRYCYYGAVSIAQRDGCMEHITEDEIRERDTNAARFAYEEPGVCGDDSGPFCQDAWPWPDESDRYWP